MAKKTTAEILAELRAKDSGGKAAPAAGSTAPASDPAEAAASESAAAAEGPADAVPAAPAPADKPKSTKDILARLRSESKGGAPPAAPAKKPAAAPKKSAAPTTASAATAGAKPSPQEMLKALRESKQAAGGGADAVTAEVVEAPERPARGRPAALRKPVARKAAEPDKGRRNVILAILAAPLVVAAHPLAMAWTFFSAATAAFSLALARFMMPNVLVEPPSQFKVGSPSDYPGGTVSTKWKAEYGVWIVHTEYEGKNLIYALFSICTHLGCTPNWLEGEQKFKCPCHGSGFYINGVNFEGPAPRPLERTAIRIAPDGMLEVDKSQKFQQELGQWDDPKSFIELA
jgi:cytochrome b6-f complex iron-sulfur subunit